MFHDERSLIIVVDDNPGTLYTKRKLLEREGYRVREASTGEDALTLAKASLPDLLLLDVNLPDMNGFDVCEQLKTQPDTRFIKVLQTSAVSIGASDRVKGLEVGADAYLIEPAEEEELLGTVRALLKLAHHERDNRQLNERLAESEARFRTMAEAVPSFLFETDAAGWNTWTSEGWCRFTGQTAEQVAGHGWAEALHPEDRAANVDRWMHCMKDAVPFESKQRLRRADGTYVWVIARASPVRDEDGIVQRWVGSVTDVDEIVRTQESLRESEATLLRAQRCARAGVWDMDLLTDRVQWSAPYYELYGLPRDVKPSQENWIASVHPEDRARVEAEFGLALVVRGAHSIEFRITRDGEIRWLNSEGHVTCDAAGRPIRMAGITWDITERKQAEEALQQRNRQLELLALVSQRLLLGGEAERQLLDTVFSDIAQLIDMEMFYHYRPSEEPRMLRLHTAGGVTEKERCQFATMRFGELVCGRVAERRERIIVEDLQHSSYPGSDGLKAAGATSYAGFPLVANGELVGTIAFISNRRKHLCEGDVQMVQTICDQIATALERTKLQRELRESEERWRLALTGSTDGIWDWDVQKQRVFLSTRWKEQRGYGEEEIGVDETEWSSRIHPEDYDRVMATVQAYLNKETAVFHCEYRSRCKDGGYLWVLDRGIALWDEQGRAIRMIGSETDITKRKQAEENLRESGERLRVLTRAMPQLVWVANNVGECIYQAPQWETITGQSTSDSLKYGWVEMIHPEDRARAASEWRGVVAHGVTYQTEYRIHMKDGTYRWYLTRAEALRDGSGSIVQWIGTSTDIDEAKRTEAALRQSEERLRLATEAAAVGIWEWNVKTNQVRWDAQMFKIYQIPPTADGLVPYSTWSHAVVPHDLPEQERVLAETVRTCGSSSRQFRIRRYGDGEERYIEAVETARRDARGDTEWVVGTNIDVTERKQAEEALTEQKRLYQSITDNASLALIIMNERQHCVFMNPAAEHLTGYRFTETQGRPLHEVVHHTRPDGWPYPLSECPIDQAFPEKNRTQGEEVFVHKDGHFYQIAFTASPLLDEIGHPVGTVIEVQDITERKQAEQALHEAQQRLQRWNVELEQAVNVKTAELRHSQERLRAMTSELNLAEQRERKRLATELHDHLQQMLVLGKLEIGQGKRFAAGVPGCEGALKRVDTILSDALTYSRTLVAELSPPVLHEFGMGAGLSWLGTYMKKHGLTVTVSVPEEAGQTLPESHTVLLFQSVRELLINASKHAGTGTATVQLTQSHDHVQIEVHDDGCGFDLAAAAAAGTPHGGISSKFGLLSIQERMRALGGAFDIQSAPGQGTTATLSLPLAQPVGVKREASGEGDEAERSGLMAFKKGSASALASRLTPDVSRVVRVLLVDDHIMVRQGLRAVLESYADIELIGEAANGEEALQLADQHRPSVVVMDISMPGMNGIEATSEIKNRYPETVVIGLSVNADEENKEAMKRAGAVCLMTKEAAVEELYDAIQQAMSRSIGQPTGKF